MNRSINAFNRRKFGRGVNWLFEGYNLNGKENRKRRQNYKVAKRGQRRRERQAVRLLIKQDFPELIPGFESCGGSPYPNLLTARYAVKERQDLIQTPEHLRRRLLDCDMRHWFRPKFPFYSREAANRFRGRTCPFPKMWYWFIQDFRKKQLPTQLIPLF